MCKFKTILYLTIIIMSSTLSLVAEARDNATVCDTNSTILTNSTTLTNSSTPTPVKTESNTSNPTTETQVNTGEQAFRVGPTVSLRPLNSETNKSQDGIVELFMNNPNLNDVTLEVDMAVDVPSDIYIHSQEGGMTGGAGTVTGHFTVPPGSSRTITLHVKGEKVGTYSVHFSGLYWPGINKNKWNPITLDSSFAVTEPSYLGSESISKTAPGVGAASLILILMIVYFVRRK